MDATTAHWTITEAWEKALGHDGFTDDDDFFAVGGDSLRATLVVRTLDRAGLGIDLADFMATPTVTGLVAAALRQTDDPKRPKLRRIAR